MRALLPILHLLTLLGACASADRHTGRCEGAEERLAGPRQDDSPTIYDRRIQSRLARELGDLHHQERTVALRELRDQLQRRSTAVRLPAAGEETLDPAALYARARRSVVVFGKRYRCDKCTNWHLSCATGVALAADGVVATAHHVLDDDDDDAVFGVMTDDGTVRPVVEILATDPRADVALVRVQGAALEPLPLQTGIDVGAPVWVLSHPAQTFWYLSHGHVGRRFLRNVRGGSEPVELLDVTADFARGSSGGPVLDATGAVVGIVRATRSIYYKEEDDVQRDLQMVLKHCAPASAVQAMVRSDG